MRIDIVSNQRGQMFSDHRCDRSPSRQSRLLLNPLRMFLEQAQHLFGSQCFTDLPGNLNNYFKKIPQWRGMRGTTCSKRSTSLLDQVVCYNLHLLLHCFTSFHHAFPFLGMSQSNCSFFSRQRIVVTTS